MSEDAINQSSLVLPGISQFNVDFIISKVDVDIPIGIDPFLLWKSRDSTFQNLHLEILNAFNAGINLIKTGKTEEARVLFDFPEVPEIGLGYTKKGRKGSGLGDYLSKLIVETLIDSPSLQDRGIKHIEEMQLVALNIGPDRISDIAANLIKKFLIEYTQKQCHLWQIPLFSGVPIDHIFDASTFSWYDGYFDLPVSPIDKSPILLVPRRIARVLPWINYEDFFRLEFSTYLRAKRVRKSIAQAKSPLPKVEKEAVISLTRTEIDRLDRYIKLKEESFQDAQPSQNYTDTSQLLGEGLKLKTNLSEIKTGREEASKFQLCILEILNFLFNPELIDGELEVATIDGTERRDIIFTNDSDQSFWTYLRNEHSSVFLMFEVKNTENLDNFHMNQVATYLGERLGRLGFIVTRSAIKESHEKKAFSIYNDSNPKKIILTISDLDLCNMIDMKCQGNDPMRHIQKLYRAFRTKAQ